ncbi:chemotaxis protein CheA [Sphingomicrobium lutaoense]|uniref:Chemotaxis protein CheA n=1 Tax=Sphingomicrobium lutaoense TaxID=515949 RepID=A0A839Z4R1_9SPHN|nr:chemotaxis protein CheA [Sphingomicrobium lutaoense]MBB3763644.1 two-component system chemotaxis sensor kinase CheA [Sphingomicrobium lutaoense]
MDDLIADFVAECREMLEALGGEIIAWEAQPDNRERLDNIFRFVHTVKGNCGFFDFPRLEALSHAAEDALADVRSGHRVADHALVSAVLGVIDRIGEFIEIIARGEEIPAGSDRALIAALAAPGDAAHESEAPAPVEPVQGEGDTPSTHQAQAPRTIRLSVELLDRVMSGVSDMVLARNELSRRLREAPEDVEVAGAFERLSSIIAEMRDAITQTRMQRIENLFVGLPRLVRDLSTDLGKQVMIDIDGGDVELDREMIEMIRDPLTHIIRNAVDHGIEKPADRLAKDKREIGMLRVAARQSGNQILIDIIDDGAGIDAERLVEKALQNGVINAAQRDSMTEAQKLQLIFAPGLSTAREVTSVSGRGVGMDVVRSNIEKIGGVVDVESTVGEGTCMTLRVPLTLTIMPALTVSIAGQHFAIPRTAIVEIVRANGHSVKLETVGGAGVATIRGQRMPRVTLSDLLDLPSDMADEDRTLVLLRPTGRDIYALAVDRIHDHEELVVKPAAPAVMGTGLYAGTTLADDGSPILLFDAAGLASVGGIRFDNAAAAGANDEDQQVAANDDFADMLVFHAIDGTRRAVHLALVDRIEEVEAGAVRFAAGRTRVQIGERILPLAGIADPKELDGSKLRVFRLTDGDQEIGYAFDRVVDQLKLDHEVIAADTPGEVAGVALLGDEPAELIDVHWLFADLIGAATVRSTARPRCRLPAGDPWIQHMLRPMVEAAGYEIISGSDGDAVPDLVIMSEDEEDVPAASARKLVIRARPDGSADSIYRYDRAGLMLALKNGVA